MKKQTMWILIIVGLVLIAMCCCMAVVAGSGLVLFLGPSIQEGYNLGQEMAKDEEFPEDAFYPPSSAAFEMIEVLESVDVPGSDLVDLGERLLNITGLPDTIPAKDYQLGDTESFWISDSDTNETFSISTTLEYETEHTYFWIEEGVKFDEEALQELAETFENEIYPTDREFFGSEFTPGIDDDPHLYLIYARGLGGNVAGYFSSIDSVHPALHEYSNAHESFVFSADSVDLSDEYTYSVLAHEFQHMIHWYQDLNETTWMNEGFSELAVVLNGYNPGGFDSVYLMSKDTQLNTWPIDPMMQGIHYGSSFLFMQYFLDRFGEEATRALVHETANGLQSIDLVLKDLDIRDPETNEVMTADDVFMDWAITSEIDNEAVAQGQYAYYGYSPLSVDSDLLVPKYKACDTGEWYEGNVSQYGVDPVILSCTGDYLLTFEGIGEVGVLPVDPIEGDFAMYSNKGDQSDMRLTREFDFSTISGPIEFTYSVWYDLEEEYDYLYLLVSEDGQQWDMIETENGTGADPVGNNYGWGYNGSSDGWLEESVDLSEYAGKKIWLRYEYVTDAALNGEGLLLDNLRIDAVQYSTDFEDDNGGWVAEGFVRMQNALAQRFAVSVVYEDGDDSWVEKFQFWGGESFSIPVSMDQKSTTVRILVSGLTRATQQPANYRFQLAPMED